MIAMNHSTRHHHPWVDLAMYEDHQIGKSLETFLAENGIAARIYDDKLFRRFLFLRPPRATYRIQVQAHHYADAIRLLNEKLPASLGQALHCPSCGSLRVNYPQMTRQFIVPTVALHLGILLRILEHQCYCENCQQMWTLPRDAAVPRKVREVKPFPF